MFWTRWFKWMSHDMAIDLGTANTLVYVRGRGIVLNEPSVVAIETINGVKKVKAVGEDAKLMMGKTPDQIEAIRPLRDGVIADIDVAEQMIKHFIHKVHGGKMRAWRFPEIVICVPSGSTSVERRAIRDAASNAGASAVYLIEEPMAAAIGADMPVTAPIGSMVVDIGGGTTEVAVLSLRGLAYTTSVRVGGDKMDEAISSYVRRNHNLADRRSHGRADQEGSRDRQAADRRHRQDGPHQGSRPGQRRAQGNLDQPGPDRRGAFGAGRDDRRGRPDRDSRIRRRSWPPTSATRVSCSRGVAHFFRASTRFFATKPGLPVTVAEDPLTCVALGTGRALEEEQFRGVLQTA